MLEFKQHRSQHRKPMPISRATILIMSLMLLSLESGSRGGPAIWDSRCEECHGDSATFAGKYLWQIGGQLQGQHHVNNMDMFMRNHYIPDHEIDTIKSLLLSQANRPARFETECGECHGDINSFVEKSLWVGKENISGMESGADIGDFLPTHRELDPENTRFYLKLFFRIAGKPAPSALFSTEPGLQFN